jgi:hypothetical protein
VALEAAAVFAVAEFVAGEFGEPVFPAGGGDSAAAATDVHVPEAAADVDDFSACGGDEIGGASGARSNESRQVLVDDSFDRGGFKVLLCTDVMNLEDRFADGTADHAHVGDAPRQEARRVATF